MLGRWVVSPQSWYFEPQFPSTPEKKTWIIVKSLRSQKHMVVIYPNEIMRLNGSISRKDQHPWTTSSDPKCNEYRTPSQNGCPQNPAIHKQIERSACWLVSRFSPAISSSLTLSFPHSASVYKKWWLHSLHCWDVLTPPFISS